MLVACGDSGLANQAVKEAREAFEDGSYQEGVGFLKLATDESIRFGMSKGRLYLRWLNMIS